MSYPMHEDKLRKALEVLFDEMQKLGLLPKDVPNKDAVIDQVMQSIGDSQLTPDMLKKPEVQKSIWLKFNVAVMHQNNPSLALQFEKLTEKLFNKDLDKEEFRAEAKDEIKNLLRMMNTLRPELKPMSEKEIDEFSEQFVEKMRLEQEENAQLLAEHSGAVDTMCESMDMFLRMLFGGINPTYTGGVRGIVLECVAGNEAGIVNQSATNDATSGAFIDRSSGYNPESEDALGIEHSILGRLAGMSSPLIAALEDQDLFYQPPRPKGPLGQ